MTAIFRLTTLSDQLKDANPLAAEVINEAVTELLNEARYERWAGQPRPAPTVRVRINVSDSVKGIRTTDTTLEHSGDLRDTDLDQIVEMRLALTAKVDAAYPPPLAD